MRAVRRDVVTALAPSPRQLAAYTGLAVEEVESKPDLLQVQVRRHRQGRSTLNNSVVLEPGPRLAQFVRLGGPARYPHTSLLTGRGREPGFWVPLPSGTLDLRTSDGFVLWSYVPEKIDAA